MKQIVQVPFYTLILTFCTVTHGYTQWNRVEGFSCISNTSELVDSNYIWGGGNLGNLYKFDYQDLIFSYFNIDSSLDIYTIWYTNDSCIQLGGRNWQNSNGFLAFFNPIKDTVESYISFPHEIQDIEYLTDSLGIIVNYSGIYKSIDGGSNWNLVWDFESFGAKYGELYSLTSDNHGNVYAAGEKRQNIDTSLFQGFVLKSVDSGSTWEICLENNGGHITNLKVSGNTIYCHDRLYYSYYMSNNNGKSWHTTEIPVMNPNLRLFDVQITNNNHVFVCLSQEYLLTSGQTDFTVHQILSSPDSGDTWFVQFENHPRFPPLDSTMNDIVYTNDSTLFCFGWRFCLKTSNLGGTNHRVLNAVTAKSQDLSVYPNPSKDYLIIENLFPSEVCTISDINGKVLKQFKILHQGKRTIDVLYWEPGVYIINSRTAKGETRSALFMKQ